MSRGRITAIVITLVCLLFFGLYIWYNYYMSKKFNYWGIELKTDGEKPYDLKLFYSLLKEKSKDHGMQRVTKLHELERTLTREVESGKPGTYMFSGWMYFITRPEIDTLCWYVGKGNRAVIMASNLPEHLMNKIWGSGSHWYPDAERRRYFSTSFTHPSLAGKTFRFQYRSHNQIGLGWDWSSVGTSGHWEKDSSGNGGSFKMPQFAALTKTGANKTDFIRIPYGKGYFYIHFNPILLTNLYLSREPGKRYTERMLQHLPDSKIIWDAASTDFKWDFDFYGGRSETPLGFILSRKALRNAWYLILSMVLLFVLFRAKRRQRIIPILPANRNTTLEFTETIGNFYFNENNPKELGQQRVKLFMDFLRFKYRIRTSLPASEIIPGIAIKSQVPEHLLQRIFELNDKISTLSIVHTEEIIEQDQLLTQFYQICNKKHHGK